MGKKRIEVNNENAQLAPHVRLSCSLNAARAGEEWKAAHLDTGVTNRTLWVLRRADRGTRRVRKDMLSTKEDYDLLSSD